MTAIPHPLVLPRLPRRVTWWLLAIAIWTLCPILIAFQAVVHSTWAGQPVSWSSVLPLRLADWYTCAIFTPLFFWLVRRTRVGVQVAFIPAAVVVKYALYVELARRILPAQTWRFDATLTRSFVSESIAFAAVLAIVHGIEYHRRWREREVQAARLEAELASARLDALTAQLQPHFLFNTLNSVSTLMRRDPDAAEEMLTHLGDLLHRTLRLRDRHEVTLAEELELLQHYLDIMKIRFQDRLTVRIDVDANVASALVPHLVLQPLVENAIRHGISRRPGAGLLELRAHAASEMLVISVGDDGEGLHGGGEGIGLSNTRRRLRQLYGDAHALELTPAESGGLKVTLRIPLHSK